MCEAVGALLQLGVGPPLAVGDEVFPFTEMIDGVLEEVGEIEFHRSRSSSVAV